MFSTEHGKKGVSGTWNRFLMFCKAVFVRGKKNVIYANEARREPPVIGNDGCEQFLFLKLKLP